MKRQIAGSVVDRYGGSGLILLGTLLFVAVVSAITSQLFLGSVFSLGSSGRLEATWGQYGLTDGRLDRPRAIAIDNQDRIYLVDKRARIQVYSPDGQYLRGWQTPSNEFGNPGGLSIARDGNLLVADTHYYRMLVYTPEGQLLRDRTIGGELGPRPGQMGWVTDAVQDSQGNYYISEYCEYDRIQKFSPDGRYLFQWGGNGREPGQFMRPQNLAVDQHDHVWVADACNHRIQVFDPTGDDAKLVRIWGSSGSAPGQLSYPYDLALDGKGHVYVCEYRNNRVQKFTLDGTAVGSWGYAGKEDSQLWNPWALARDKHGRIFVVDTNNHRVHRIRL